MPNVTFHRDYNHTWPSRAMTKYPAGWSGVVKREVAAAAVPNFADPVVPESEKVAEAPDSQ